MLDKIYRTIDISKLQVNENQPRKNFDDAKIAELAQSIKTNGLIQPLVVRKYKNGFQIIAGERRYRACKQAGINRIPCIVKNYNDQEVEAMAVIENIQREDLSPLEEAIAYKALMENQKLNQSELAQQIGKSQSTIANKLRLLKLSDDVKFSLDNKQITERHARAMLSLDKQHQQEVLREVLKKELNVKQTENLVAAVDLKSKLPKKVVKGNMPQLVKVAVNTIKQATDLIKQSGVEVNQSYQDNDDEYIITIKISK